jgi:hypothetical protein
VIGVNIEVVAVDFDGDDVTAAGSLRHVGGRTSSIGFRCSTSRRPVQFTSRPDSSGPIGAGGARTRSPSTHRQRPPHGHTRVSHRSTSRLRSRRR